MSIQLDWASIEAEADEFADERESARENDPALSGAIADAEARVKLLRELAAIRRASGLRQQDVADAMGTSQSAISELEGSDSDPHVSTLQRLARACGAELHLRCSRSVGAVTYLGSAGAAMPSAAVLHVSFANRADRELDLASILVSAGALSGG